METAEETGKRSIEVAISAVDEALCASLVSLLAASGFRSERLSSLSDFITRPAQQQILIADLRLLEQAGTALNAALQKRRWDGTVIVMMEDDRISPPILKLDSHKCRFLVKPFSYEQVIDLLDAAVKPVN